MIRGHNSSVDKAGFNLSALARALHAAEAAAFAEQVID
jgi:hypothetical protein